MEGLYRRINRSRFYAIVVMIGATLFISLPIFGLPSCNATVVWSDDFSDGDYEGWTVLTGSFSAADNILKATGPGSTIYHPSTAATGTWSFDVNHSSEYWCPYVWFMVEDFDAGSTQMNGYCLHISPYTGIELMRGRLQDTILLDRYEPPEGVYGWWHYEVTRAIDGTMYVYLNGTLILHAIDTEFSGSQYFYFNGGTGHALDNVIVSNSIDITPGPADLLFTESSVVTSCPQVGSTTANLYVQNYGEAFGSATLVTGSTPSGVTVSLSTTSITDLGQMDTQMVQATINVTSTCTLGNYTMDIELREDTLVLDTLQIHLTVTPSTTTPPPPAIPGFPWIAIVLGVLGPLGMIGAHRRRKHMPQDL